MCVLFVSIFSSGTIQLCKTLCNADITSIALGVDLQAPFYLKPLLVKLILFQRDHDPLHLIENISKCLPNTLLTSIVRT